jgi:hypothetical protein
VGSDLHVNEYMANVVLKSLRLREGRESRSLLVESLVGRSSWVLCEWVWIGYCSKLGPDPLPCQHLPQGTRLLVLYVPSVLALYACARDALKRTMHQALLRGWVSEETEEE